MFDIWRLPVVKLCFICTLATLSVVGVWALNAPFAIDASSFKAPAMLLPVYVAFMFGAWAVYQRLAADMSRPARVIKFIASRFYDHAAVFVFMLSYAPVAVLFSYLTISAGFPMQDSLYANIDAALGFNWDALLLFVNAHPSLGWFLTTIYISGAAQMGAVFVLLVAVGRIVELWDFVALLMLGSIGTIVISGLMPAVAPYTYYGVDPSHFAALEHAWPGVGRWHVADVLALHSGFYRSFALGQNHGLVTFPSYHTYSAIVLVYGVRSFKWLFWPMAALSSAVVVSTLPIGGHYLADVIGGAMLAVASIALIEWLNVRPSMWSRARPHIRAVAGWSDRPVTLPAGSI